jgi:hypothetical protein
MPRQKKSKSKKRVSTSRTKTTRARVPRRSRAVAVKKTVTISKGGTRVRAKKTTVAGGKRGKGALKRGRRRKRTAIEAPMTGFDVMD